MIFLSSEIGDQRLIGKKNTAPPEEIKIEEENDSYEHAKIGSFDRLGFNYKEQDTKLESRVTSFKEKMSFNTLKEEMRPVFSRRGRFQVREELYFFPLSGFSVHRTCNARNVIKNAALKRPFSVEKMSIQIMMKKITAGSFAQGQVKILRNASLYAHFGYFGE